MSTIDMANTPEVAEYVNQEVEKVRQVVEANAGRVAALGAWPSYIKPGSLLERIPKSGDVNAPGFDAGIACAIDMIPRDKQELAARLHANYSRDAVAQVRSEAGNDDPDSQTAWWLAACSVCKDGEVDGNIFLGQIKDFKKLAENPEARAEAARERFQRMTSAFQLKDGVPFGEKDGCIQGAYIAGYPYGSQYAANYGIYFIGTYEDSLGLEEFAWSSEVDDKGRAKSGPVFGSKQFVKCANEDEWKRAMEVVKAKLPFDPDAIVGSEK